MKSLSFNDETLPLSAHQEETPASTAPVGDQINGQETYLVNVNGDGQQKDESTTYGSTSKGTTGRKVLARTHSSFWEDAIEFREGSIPQSIIVAMMVGVVCGLSAYLYYTALEFLLEFLWHTLPEKYGITSVFWIPAVGFSMALLVGLSVVLTGEPGDLAYTIKCVHESAYISMDHVLPMLLASQFSILGGGSLGPEAPLVAICAALAGFISRKVFGQTRRNVIRKHTLMGMAGALAAFFGVPLGGSLFALEVNSRFGVEYFEHLLEAIFAGEITLVVFRAASGLPIAPIWNLSEEKVEEASPYMVLIGGLIGLLGAGIAGIFAWFHWNVVDFFDKLNLLDNRNAVQRALLGAIVIVGFGMVIPQTMFWGENEFQQIATLAPPSDLEHIYPTSGLTNFQMSGFFSCMAVGISKLVAISFTVAGGYRGGFIFPFFACGAAFGRAFGFLLPGLFPSQVACLCFAAGINVAITRTSLASTLILAYLAGEPNAIAAILFASLVSLIATSYMPFIKTQLLRSDIDDSLYLAEHEGDEWERDRHHHNEDN